MIETHEVLLPCEIYKRSVADEQFRNLANRKNVEEASCESEWRSGDVT